MARVHLAPGNEDFKVEDFTRGIYVEIETPCDLLLALLPALTCLYGAIGAFGAIGAIGSSQGRSSLIVPSTSTIENQI